MSETETHIKDKKDIEPDTLEGPKRARVPEINTRCVSYEPTSSVKRQRRCLRVSLGLIHAFFSFSNLIYCKNVFGFADNY